MAGVGLCFRQQALGDHGAGAALGVGENDLESGAFQEFDGGDADGGDVVVHKGVVEEDDGATGGAGGGCALVEPVGEGLAGEGGEGAVFVDAEDLVEKPAEPGVWDARLARGAKRLPMRLSRLMWAKIFALRGVPWRCCNCAGTRT